MKRFVTSAVIAMVVAVWATSASALNGPKVFSVLDVGSNIEQPMAASRSNNRLWAVTSSRSATPSTDGAELSKGDASVICRASARS